MILYPAPPKQGLLMPDYTGVVVSGLPQRDSPDASIFQSFRSPVDSLCRERSLNNQEGIVWTKFVGPQILVQEKYPGPYQKGKGKVRLTCPQHF